RLGIDMKGSLHSDVVTAHWTTEATLHGGDITLGIPMKNVRGVIGITSGKFDGTTVSAVGSAAFEQATILTLPFTELQTPFRVEGSLVSIGAPSWDNLKPSEVKPRFAGRSMKAALYGGHVSVDATANVDPVNSERSTYALQLLVEGVKLHAIAQANQWRERLYGDIRASLSLRGVGSDVSKIVTEDRTKNWVQIQPARLLDLPIFVRLFELISFTPGENFMFNSAEGEFRIKDAQVDFSSIRLEGASISLIGQGTVGLTLSHALDLQFLHRARSQYPVLKQLTDALGRGWIAISVRGTVENPVVNQQPRLPIVTPAIDALMRSMEQPQMRPVSRPAAR
ncbi:MAG TPA: AsmA-like C-terminal region-containing protein, partial [Caulifigura sp.]|nr:AsmA-like C-terminal region-containing protein [Caulifigura sp.]